MSSGGFKDTAIRVSSAASNVLLDACSAANNIGDSTSAITTIGVMAVGDIVSLHTTGSAANFELARIFAINGSVITWEEPLKVAHANGDSVINAGDAFNVWLPGGDVWELCFLNNSGQALVVQIDAIEYRSDTIS